MKTKKKLLIGVTGGIGSGKTEVCKLLSKRGFKVLHSDKIAKNLYRTDKKLVKDIIKVFGKDIVNYKGKINLPKLREKIFSSRKYYTAINKIVHPVVISDIKKFVKDNNYDIVIIESALIFESGLSKSMDYIITVFSNKKERIDRLKIRDEASTKSINELMKFQVDEKKKMEQSDFVIINNKSLKDLKIQTDFLSKILKAL
ncbi:MAG TPA: dephospho-CoA kinase [Ignavibacteria bacterium]|nr:dephospho-CoA kinase [Bacteroidota bacterium]HRI84133.1 dephospho-CoA kinase [Ignavibacteria bacterium]HRJ98114.1 dephospho-CoA kinase [Ignavibacteria bacterium]